MELTGNGEDRVISVQGRRTGWACLEVVKELSVRSFPNTLMF